jgi:hypothetical protein
MIGLIKNTCYFLGFYRCRGSDQWLGGFLGKKKPLRILSGPKEEEKYVNPLQRVIIKRHI